MAPFQLQFQFSLCSEAAKPGVEVREVALFVPVRRVMLVFATWNWPRERLRHQRAVLLAG